MQSQRAKNNSSLSLFSSAFSEIEKSLHFEKGLNERNKKKMKTVCIFFETKTVLTFLLKKKCLRGQEKVALEQKWGKRGKETNGNHLRRMSSVYVRLQTMKSLQIKLD